jgi:hypothetical protein
MNYCSKCTPFETALVLAALLEALFCCVQLAFQHRLRARWSTDIPALKLR